LKKMYKNFQKSIYKLVKIGYSINGLNFVCGKQTINESAAL